MTSRSVVENEEAAAGGRVDGVELVRRVKVVTQKSHVTSSDLNLGSTSKCDLFVVQ